jgi:hypothetical protein
VIGWNQQQMQLVQWCSDIRFEQRFIGEEFLKICHYRTRRKHLPEEVEKDLAQHWLHFEEISCEYDETYVLM